MENLNNIFARLTENLTTTDGIDLMYYDIKNLGDIKIITFNVVSSYDNISDDRKLFIKIVSTMEVIKQLLNNKALVFNFNIRNAGTFSKENLDEDTLVYAKEGILNAKSK